MAELAIEETTVVSVIVNEVLAVAVLLIDKDVTEVVLAVDWLNDEVVVIAS